jgi:hypothetical protein
MRKIIIAAALAAMGLAAGSASATGGYRYEQAGTLNAARYEFFAAGDGDLTVYTMNGTGSYLSKLGVKVNGQTITSGILPTGSPIFVPTNVGRVTAGDLIEFFIDTYDRDPAETYLGTYHSNVAYNADGLQHVFASEHPDEWWIGVPTGTFFGFEDTTTGDSRGDLNYNDYAFVVPGLTQTRPVGGAPEAGVPSPAPEPATWATMLIGFGASGAALRARKRTRAIAA